MYFLQVLLLFYGISTDELVVMYESFVFYRRKLLHSCLRRSLEMKPRVEVGYLRETFFFGSSI